MYKIYTRIYILLQLVLKACLHLGAFRCDFLLLMYVNEWMSYECSDEDTHTQSIHNLFTRSHPLEEENCIRNRSKNCKCKRALTSEMPKILIFTLNYIT